MENIELIQTISIKNYSYLYFKSPKYSSEKDIINAFENINSVILKHFDVQDIPEAEGTSRFNIQNSFFQRFILSQNGNPKNIYISYSKTPKEISTLAHLVNNENYEGNIVNEKYNIEIYFQNVNPKLINIIDDINSFKKFKYNNSHAFLIEKK